MKLYIKFIILFIDHLEFLDCDPGLIIRIQLETFEVSLMRTCSFYVKYVGIFLISLKSYFLILISSRVGEAQRNYILQTTFPSRDLKDEKQTLIDASLLNSVVVQRYI